MSGTGASATQDPRPRVGVSSCLLGEPVRFNGGLGTPRETLRLTVDSHLVSRGRRA